MPTYEYQCNSCGYNFSQFQNMKDDPVENCPECGKTVRRLISGGSGIIFKETGFYQTDYKAKESCCGQSKGCDHPKRCCDK